MGREKGLRVASSCLADGRALIHILPFKLYLQRMYPATTPHLNPYKCEIRGTVDKGRGVFATQQIPAQTTIDVSPVLLFSKEEYDRYGQHTIVDHYTFKWRDGRMALALGLGSIFNHASRPNVSYILDNEHACITYVTMRPVDPGDELCIFYGNKLWFEDGSRSFTPEEEDEEGEDVWTRLASVDLHQKDEKLHELVPEPELPFERVTVIGEEEEESNSIETIEAWAVDIPDQRKTAYMIEWLKQSGLEHPSLKHAKHIRRWMDTESSPKTTMLLTPADMPPPAVPGDVKPYIIDVPRFPARTMEQVKMKTVIWPVFYEAQNHREIREEGQRWTREIVQWFRDAVAVIRKEAKRARRLGEIPIVSYVPAPHDAPPGTRTFLARDTRVSTQHPLRHSIFNLIRLVGDAAPLPESSDSSKNGQNYLLTSLTLFTTHEPCIACSMALLHSRVKEVIYLYAMPKTGGCGSLTCIPALMGVNHRYKLWKWRGVPAGVGGVQADVDA
ncbi:hypothetical protein K439DRAFT_1402625, partial [Ramaria rubella]